MTLAAFILILTSYLVSGRFLSPVLFYRFLHKHHLKCGVSPFGCYIMLVFSEICHLYIFLKFSLPLFTFPAPALFN